MFPQMTPVYYHMQQQIWYFSEPGTSSVVYLGQNITTLLGKKTALWGKEVEEHSIEGPTMICLEKLWSLLLL